MTTDAKGALIIGGYFPQAGGVEAANVARLGADGWEPLGAGVDDVVRRVFLRKNGELVVSGDFTHAGSVAAPFLARWDGQAWAAIGAALDGPVQSLAEDADGNLYVGGDFTHAGTLEASHVARWDGKAWAALGAGLDERVTSMTVDAAGHLVAVGLFKKSGSLAVNGLATWDGAAWKGFGGGFDGSDLDYGTKVLADGQGFIVAGEGVAVDGLARWDGKAWSGFGDGLTSSAGFLLVSDVARYGEGLFATGLFDGSGQQALSYIGWFDGTAWKPLGTGLDDLGESVLVSGDTLWAGGGFLTTGGRVAIGIGAWDFAP